MRGAALARFGLAIISAAVVVGIGTHGTARASHCIITPAVGEVTVNQGLPYARLVRGKETMVKLYLRLPTNLPRCAGRTPAIKIVGGTLTVRNGATAIGPTVNPLPDAINALVISSSVLQNSPADPKFIVLGSNLPPSGSGIAGSFTATFSITLTYQSRGAPTGTTEDAFSATQSVTFTTSKLVELPTKALRTLAVPMAAALNTTHTGTLVNGLTNLSRMYPVQDLTGSGLPRVGVLPTTNGGIRYALNNPGIVNVATPFCGTSTNYGPIQTQLQAFMTAYNDANTSANDVDRTVGVIADTNTNPSSSCFQGFTVTNTQHAWVRLVPDAPGVPSTAGSLLGMEFCHTFGCTTTSATLHSYFTNADNLTENVDRAFNSLSWSWLADDRSAMRFSAPGWNNGSTVLEKSDFGYLLCGLGGANTSGCPAAGTGTLTGVAAGPTFELDGTTDGAGEATTTIGNSHKSTVAPQTAPDPASPYRFLQKAAPSPAAALVPSGGDLGVPVRVVHSGHGGQDDVGPGAVGAFSFAFPLNAGTQRIELRKGSTLLWARNLTAPPAVTNVTVSGEPPITLFKTPQTTVGRSSSEPTPKPALLRRQAAIAAAKRDARLFLELAPLSVTFTVNSSADPGDGTCDETCTLRDAILAANATLGADTIAFSLPSGETTITPTSPLPPITETITIDGTTQPGFDGTPIVELNGATISSDGDTVDFESGLTLMPEADNNTIRGLVINRFTTPSWGTGIDIRGSADASSDNNVIEGNFLGTNAAGTAAQGNLFGLVVRGVNNTIGGTTAAARNVISGQAGSSGGGPNAGVLIDSTASNNHVLGNYIGTNVGGTAALPNNFGVIVFSAGNAIAGNVLSGNQSRGLHIQGSSATGNTVTGNLIGTNAAGTAAVGNGGDALRIEGASSTTIGGSSVTARNIVSGNGGHGILLHGATNNTVQGNYAGTNAAGDAAIPNGIDGIAVDGGGNNTIGGPDAGQGNLASGNTNQGIAIFGVDFASTTGNVVQGNKAGTNAGGTAAIPNGGEGIRMHHALNTTVGGTADGAGNLVFGNTSHGVTVIVLPRPAANNRILRNSISGNGGLGIDLGLDGVTANDAGDGDGGANNLQNNPDLASVTTAAGGTTVRGRLSSEPSKVYRLEFFGNVSCDSSGRGEGQTFLGSMNVTTSASGTTSFTFTSPTAIGSTDAVTSTATDPDGNTSEFSACRQPSDTPPPPPAPGAIDVGVDATDDFPANARATVYWDCGGLKYPIKVGVPPTSIGDGTAHFDISTNSTPNCATDSGRGTVSVLVDDGFTQTPFTDVATAVVLADNQPPVVTFATPAPAPDAPPGPGAKPRPGEFLQYEGILVRLSAMDPEDNALTGNRLTLTTNIPELAGQTFQGERILLVPPQNPGTGWTPGTYQLTATATEEPPGVQTATKTLTIRILADADHDGLSAPLEQGCTGLSDSDPYTPGLDADNDSVPNGNELNTAGGPCNAETTYNAIINFDPDNVQRTSSGTPITVNVRVPFRDVTQIVGASVKITKVTYVNADGHLVEEVLTSPIPNASWAVLRGGDAQAKFDRPTFIAFLNARQIANQMIVVEVSGEFSDGTRWAGSDRTNVK